MEYNINEIINIALMTGQPVVIVEGYDDIKFYSNIGYRIGKQINIVAIETVEGFSEGCEEVIRAIQSLQSYYANDSRLIKYMVGIIDRDSRQYRETVPDLKGLFVLKGYSYESHLITKNTVTKQIELLTSIGMIEPTNEAVSYLLREFENLKKKAYLISLEALKNACVNDYDSIVKYSYKPAQIMSKQNMDSIYNEVLAKKSELDEFAEIHNISYEEDYITVIKGKWLLYLWCRYLVDKVKQLHKLCGVKIPACPMCLAGKSEKCLWKSTSNFQVGQLESYLKSKDVIDMSELGYIVERFNTLV